MHAWDLQSSERSIEYPGSELYTVVSCHGNAGNWASMPEQPVLLNADSLLQPPLMFFKK